MEPSPLLKELKNTLYHELLTSKMIDTSMSFSLPFDYTLSKKGKSVFLECKDEAGEWAALSFLSRIDLKEILNFTDKIQIKFPVRAIELKRCVDNQDAHKIKALELGFSHLVFNQAVKGESKVKAGLRVTDLTEKGFHVLGAHKFYVYRSEAVKWIEEEKELILTDLFKRELEWLEKSDKEVWFELPDNISPTALKALDIRAKRTRLIIRGELVSKLRKESKIGTSLLVTHEIRYSLWPTLEKSASDYLDCMKGHHYSGLYVKVDRLPREQGLLDLNLWSLAHAQIRGCSVSELMQTWLNNKGLKEPFNEATALANLIKVEINPSKIIYNKILLDIQLLEEKSENAQFRAFARDVRRLLHKALQESQINIPYVLRDEDFAPSFYTHAASHGGSSILTQAEVVIKKNIDTGELADSLREIYFQNTL